MTDSNEAAATEDVQVTLRREDWERIMRLVESTVPAAAQSVEDAYDWDEDEGPDMYWIEGRERAQQETVAFRDRVAAATLSPVDTTLEAMSDQETGRAR
jgi:hypothetical protein